MQKIKKVYKFHNFKSNLYYNRIEKTHSLLVKCLSHCSHQKLPWIQLNFLNRLNRINWWIGLKKYKKRSYTSLVNTHKTRKTHTHSIKTVILKKLLSDEYCEWHVFCVFMGEGVCVLKKKWNNLLQLTIRSFFSYRQWWERNVLRGFCKKKNKKYWNR